MQHLAICFPMSFATAAFVIFLSVVYYFIQNKNILPGPRGFPYFGIYPFLKEDKCHLQLQEYGKKYGDVFSFTSFGSLIINLGSAKAIREAHVNKSDCFAGRFEKFNILTYFMKDGVGMANGESWKIQRKFFIQTFKEYGLTGMRDNTAGPISDAIVETIKDLESRKGVPLNVIEVLTVRCTGVIRKVLFGEGGMSDEKICAFTNAFAIAVEGMTGAKMLLLGPVGKLLFKMLPQHRIILAQNSVIVELLMDTVKTIESNMDEDHPTCVVEDFYGEKRKRRRNNDPTWKYFTDKALVASLAQILGDSIISISYFIGCFLYALVEHPEEQEKIYKELMEVVGPNRLPTPEDRSNLQYTNAFMTEVTRTSNFFPLFPSMECTKETTIRGYRIPKGSITLLNMWQSHHDPMAYETPHKFDPSRFIPKAGKPKSESPVQFGLGVTQEEGPTWAEHRRFFLQTAKIFGFGKQVSEDIIHEEIRTLIKDVKKEDGQISNFKFHVAHVANSVVCKLLFSKTFDKYGKLFEELAKSSTYLVEVFADNRYMLVGFVYRFMMAFFPSTGRIRKARELFRKTVKEILDEHVKTFDPDNLRDYVDGYLQQAYKLEKSGELNHTFSRKRLSSVALNMMMEGTESVGGTICGLLDIASQHPDEQKLVQEELDSIVGRERLPSWADRPKLPYVEAFIQELYRHNMPFNISTHYCNFKETRIQGYKIPRRTIIVANLWTINNDPALFPEPTKFIPKRFVDENGKKLKTNGPNPFGIGKRACIGESLAQMEVFVVIASIMQNFTLYPTKESGCFKAVSR